MSDYDEPATYPFLSQWEVEKKIIEYGGRLESGKDGMIMVHVPLKTLHWLIREVVQLGEYLDQYVH